MKLSRPHNRSFLPKAGSFFGNLRLCRPGYCLSIAVLVALAAALFFVPDVLAEYPGVHTSSLTETDTKNMPLRSNDLDIPRSIASIAILPLENLSDNPLAATMVGDYIKEEFKGMGLFLIAENKKVERFLARRRIRYTGAITRVAVREMGKVLDVDAAFIGTINYYSVIGDTLIVGLNCRMLSAVDGRIIWAENVTYTGKDFEGVLGLGSVKSLESLAAMVVKDLVEDLKERFFVRDSAYGPFEIERVITYPVMGKSGGKRDINVRFLNLLGEPRIVKAIVGNQEYVLSKVSYGIYKGVVDAPNAEGTHLVDMVAVTSRREPYVFSAAGKVIVDDTAPIIEMSASREVFSSHKRGFVVFKPKLMSIDEIEEWSVKITNNDGDVIRSDRGYGRVPVSLKWKGEDGEQALVKDGNYTFSLTVKDPSGNATDVSNMVMIKNTPPEIDVDVEIVEDTVLFSFNYSPDEPIDSWRIAIVDRGGNVVKMVAGTGRTLPKRFEYPMGKDYDIKKLNFTVHAKDVAGNEFAMTKTIPSLFATKVPFAGLKGAQKILWEDF